MTVRSIRLAGPTPLVPAGALVYTAPAGYRVLMKSSRWVNTGAAATNARLWLNAIANANLILFRAIPVGETLLLENTVVLNPGDLLYAGCSAGGAANFEASGAQLLLP